MTITATIIKSDGAPAQFATVLGTTTLADPAAWTRVTALNDLVPSGGARLVISSDAAAFRFAVTPARSAQQTGEADNPPANNGVLVTGANVQEIETLARGDQVWVKQP